MKNQLDEHLTKEEIVAQPKFLPILSGLAIYFFSIAGLFVLLYFIFESGNWRSFMEGELMYNIREEILRFLLLTLVFFIPGHFLQRKMYALYHQSVIRSAMVPVLFWNVFLTISILNLFWTGEHQGASIWVIVAVWGGLNTWIITLSLFISWYFSHEKKWLYLLCFLAHCLISSAVTGFLISVEI